MEQLALLSRRRDRFVGLAKLGLTSATGLWLLGMAFYDDGVDRGGVPLHYLLTTRGTMWLSLAQVEPLLIRRLWGGPWTSFGTGSVAGTFGAVGLVASFRARMNRGALSRLGLVLTLAGLVLGAVATEAGSVAVYPATIDRDGLSRVLALIEAREPGLLARLRAGERPDLPASGGASIGFTTSPFTGDAIPRLGARLIRDRADAEGLRFLLAEQAWAAGDLPTLRRMLPIALPMPPTDRPARNDFARRLAAMGAAAGMPSAPAQDGGWIAAGAARWRTYRGWSLVLRHLMQACLLVGLAGALVAWTLRRRVAAVERATAHLAVAPSAPVPPPAPGTPRARASGRRPAGI